jgi:hypothetical protein
MSTRYLRGFLNIFTFLSIAFGVYCVVVGVLGVIGTKGHIDSTHISLFCIAACLCILSVVLSVLHHLMNQLEIIQFNQKRLLDEFSKLRRSAEPAPTRRVSF